MSAEIKIFPGCKRPDLEPRVALPDWTCIKCATDGFYITGDGYVQCLYCDTTQPLKVFLKERGIE